MSKLVRYPSTRPVGPRTRVLIVRQPIKSVGRGSESGTLPLRLALGVIVSVAILVGVWLLGALGHQLGFASAVRVPELTIDASTALANGVRMLVGAPATIIAAGVAYVGALLLAFAAVVFPAAGLAASKPLIPGGPRQPRLGVVFSHIGAIAAAVNALLVLWWSASPFRNSMMNDLPESVHGFSDWLENWRVVAGIDCLAVIATALWVVLMFRLTVPLWLKALSASAALFAAVIALACFATSMGCVAGVQTSHSVCIVDDQPQDMHLLLGSTRQQIATLHVQGTAVLVELRDRPSQLTVLDSIPLPDFITQTQPPS